MELLNLEQINKSVQKTYSKWVAEVIFAPITGGEFFQLLLQAHNSKLWVQKPLCCFTPEYQSHLQLYWTQAPFNTVHDIERVKKDSDIYTLI